MNEITPYEQAIAAKLEAVPVPDRADGIWLAIQLELDTGIPEAPAIRPAVAKRIGWYGAGGVVVLIVLLAWYFVHQHHSPNLPIPSRTLPERQAPLPAGTPPPVKDSPASDKPVKKKAVLLKPAGVKKDTVSLLISPDSIRMDLAPNAVPAPLKKDSSLLQTERPALPDVDLYRSPPPQPHGKKPRGVKGITDDDYKLTATKDSSRKKH